MWFRVKVAAWSWLLTGVLVAVSWLIPEGFGRSLFQVLPMIGGLFATIMGFLGFAEVASELIGRWWPDRSNGAGEPIGRLPAPRAERRRAA